MKLLHIDSSILSNGSVSRELSAEIVSQLQHQTNDIEIIRLDLALSPIGHLTVAHAPDKTAATNKNDQADFLAGQAALNDFLAADVIVVGAPMYNFGVPSQLKAWIDRLAVEGKTFSYTEKGPVGLCAGKKIIIASCRGGIFSEGTPLAFLDHQEAYLKAVFGFLGVTDIRVIRAEGLAMGPENRLNAIKNAKHEIATLAI